MKQEQKKHKIESLMLILKRFRILTFTMIILLSSITIIVPSPLVVNGIVVVPIDYDTIQEALDDPDCAVIEVLPGTYHESLIIERPVILYSLLGPDSTILDVPSDSIGICINSSDVLVQGFKIEDGKNGIYTAPGLTGEKLTNITLKELEIVHSKETGIIVKNATGSIEDCWIHDNTGDGLKIQDIFRLNVSGSTFTTNEETAMNISNGQEINIRANLFKNHDLAWRLDKVDDSIIQQNLIEGGAGMLLTRGTGNIFMENIMELDSYGIHLESNPLTQANEIRENILLGTGSGEAAIYLNGAEDNMVNQNIIEGSWEIGLLLSSVSTGDLSGNVISGPATGVLIDQSSNLVFEGNIIVDGSSYGVRVNDTDYVEVTGNVVVGSNLGLATTNEVLNLMVHGNVFSENNVGVRVEGPADFASVSYNVIDSNELGVDFYDTNGGTIAYNIVTENTDSGIQVLGCEDISIDHNEIVVGGLTGIRILDSGSNPEAIIIQRNNVSCEIRQPSFGPLPNNRLYGIEARRSNLTILANLLENICHQEGLEDLDSGYGIYVGKCREVPILRNTVTGYQKYGILVESPPDYPLSPSEKQLVEIENNTVLGRGFEFPTVQSGIIVKNGVNTDIKGNRVGFNWYDTLDDSAIGIGVFDAPKAVEVINNIVEGNQYGIYLSGFNGSNVSSNQVLGNIQGIHIENAGNTIITSNDINGTISIGYEGQLDSVGINIITSPSVEVTKNLIHHHWSGIEATISDDIFIRQNNVIHSDIEGIHLIGGMDAFIGSNYVAMGGDGILLTEGTYNDVVSDNRIERNERGIVVVNGIDTSITFNDVRDGSIVGILLKDDDASYVYRNSISNHGIGIQSIDSETIYMDKNEVFDNMNEGIYLESSKEGGYIKRNDLSGNGVGLLATGLWNNFIATHNNINENGVGIKIESKDSDISIEFNQITHNIAQGVLIGFKGQGNALFRNVIQHNDGTGIMVEGSGNYINRNVVNNNNNNGIWVTGNANRFVRNNAHGNKEYDAWDQGLANEWIKNQIGKWGPPGPPP